MVLAAMRDKAKHGVRGQDSETGVSQQPVSLVISRSRRRWRGCGANKHHKDAEKEKVQRSYSVWPAYQVPGAPAAGSTGDAQNAEGYAAKILN